MHNISVLWNPQGNQTVHRRNVDTDLIWYIWSVTKPFLLCWILRTIKERMTQVLTAKLVEERKQAFFSSLQFPSLRLSSLSLCSIMCAIQLLSSCSLWKLALTMPAEGIQLDRVGGEAAVGNHLLAKDTDGTNTGKMLVQQQPKKSFWQADRQTQKPEKPTASWGITACRFDAENLAARQPASYLTRKELKHWSLVFTGKVLVSLLNDWGKWKSGQVVMI